MCLGVAPSGVLGSSSLECEPQVKVGIALGFPPSARKSEDGDVTGGGKRPSYATRVVPTSSGIETPFYFATLCRMRHLTAS